MKRHISSQNNKTLFYFIIFLIIILFLYAFTKIGPQQQTTRQTSYQQSQFLGEATQTIISGTRKCTDTDGGDNQYLKGTMQYYSNGVLQKTYTDSCYLSTLTEYYCNSLAYPQSKKVTCTTGCTNGACISTTSCKNECSSSGKVGCYSSNVQQTCGNFDKDTCLEWGNILPCPTDSGFVCKDGVGCTRPCTNECEAGRSQCSGNGAQTCADYDGNGCSEWGPVSTCPAKTICTNGVCIPDCIYDCSFEGERQCSGYGYRVCGNYDDDLCLEWGTLSFCEPNNICRAGECVFSNLPLCKETTASTRTSASPSQQLALDVSQLIGQIKQLSKDITTPSTRQGTSIQTVKAKAIQRKTLMIDLMKKYPNAFLQNIITPTQRQQLPVEVQQYIEQQTSISGKLEVIHVDDFKNQKNSRFEYYIKTSNQKVNFFPTGTLAAISGSVVKVTGYQLDNNIATRTNANNFQLLQRAIVEATGDQKTAVILLKFQDTQTIPFTKEQAQQIIFSGQVQNFFREASYSKISWSGNVFGWYTISENCNYKIGQYTQKAIDLADPYIDFRQYQRIVLIFGGTCTGGGMGSVGKHDVTTADGKITASVAWIGAYSSDIISNDRDHSFIWSYLDFVLSHELGHNLGVWHANHWECGPGIKLYGENCYHNEYGNVNDVMGVGATSLHFNAVYKDVYKWFDPASILTITQSGRYTLKPYETTSGARIAKILPSNYNNPPYYLEYRRPIGFDADLNNPAFWDLTFDQKGLFINKIIRPLQDAPDYLFTRLLDMSPTNSNWEDWFDTTLEQNQGAFYDAGNGITIGPIISADENQITFDVKIEQPTCVPPEGY